MEINKPVSTIIVMVISLMLVFLFVLPKYQEAKGLQSSLSQKQAEYNGKAVYYSKMSELLSGIQNRKIVLEKITSALPSDFSLADVTYFFQKNAKDSGLTVRSVEFSQISPVAYRKAPAISDTKELKNILLTIDFVGSYQGFKKFLSVLDMSSRLFETNMVSFALVEGSPAKTNVKNAVPIYNFKLEVITHAY